MKSVQFKVSTRLVILTGRVALKLPFDRRGYLQGVNERFLASKYAHSDLLAPVLWSRCGIVLQRRCKALNSLDALHVAKVKHNIPELRIERCDLHNVKNWGVLNGRVVLLDYGLTEEVSKMYP